MLPKIITFKFYALIKKGCRKLYDILIGNNTPTTPPQKWMNTIGITPEEWNFFNGIVRNTQEVKLKDFQFRINNHILVTFLYKINKTDNDSYFLCDQDSETISLCFTIVIRLKNSGQLLKTGYR